MNVRTHPASVTAGPHPHRGRPATPFLRERILESASMLFAEREFDRVLIDEVAARARVGKGSVYRRFASKEELYAAVVIAGFDELQKQILAALPHAQSTRAKIGTIVRHALHFFWARRQFFALLRDPEALPRGQKRIYHAQRENLARMVAEVLRDGVEHGAIRGDLDTRLAAESVLGMVRGLNRYGREFATPDIAVETIVAIFFEGCAAPESAKAIRGANIASTDGGG
ncbi:MAG TPA: TetR/AcrR family transcriptional regulator [Candidatus Binataceae bacterium]|nr:TetR/AcrR family transcriptional regulator [Candidatus Binataceae bacterium]